MPFALLFAVLAFVQAPAGTPTFTVCVAAPMRDGFLDVTKDIADTMKDISDKIKNDKQLTLVDRKEDADVVIVVVARGRGSETYGQRTSVYKNYYGGATVETLPVVANTRWITTMLVVGAYRREFAAARTNASTSSLGDWSENADEIVRNIHAWVVTNADNLRAKRVKGK